MTKKLPITAVSRNGEFIQVISNLATYPNTHKNIIDAFI